MNGDKAGTKGEALQRSVSLVSMTSRTDLLQEAPQATEPNSSRKKAWNLTKKAWRSMIEFMMNPRVHQEALRTLVAILVFATVTCLMMAAQIFSDAWFDKYSKQLVLSNTKVQALAAFRDIFAVDPLHDRLFEWIPDWQHLRGVLPDTFLTTYIASFALFNVFWIHRKRIQFQGLVVLRRFLWIMSCLYLFRMMTFLVTTVPNPIHNCVPKYANTADFEAYLSLIGDMASGRVSACTDNIYSGHTTLTVVILFSFWMYSGLLILQIFALLHAFLIISAILLTRLHYTIDVLIAMFMSAFVFLTFHFLLTIMLDDRLLKMNQDVNTIDPVRLILENERRTLHRVYKEWINKAVWWADGFDLRLASKSGQEAALSKAEMEDAEVLEEIEEENPETSEANRSIPSPTVHQV